jgi:hypothetical protein
MSFGTLNALTVLSILWCSTGKAGEVQIVNKSGRALNVSLWSLTENKWSDLGARSRQAVQLLDGYNLRFPAHSGKYRLIALVSNQQHSRKVEVHDEKSNKFVITRSALMGDPPGVVRSGPRWTYDIQEDHVELRETSGKSITEPGSSLYASNLGIWYEQVA